MVTWSNDVSPIRLGCEDHAVCSGEYTPCSRIEFSLIPNRRMLDPTPAEDFSMAVAPRYILSLAKKNSVPRRGRISRP